MTPTTETDPEFLNPDEVPMDDPWTQPDPAAKEPARVTREPALIATAIAAVISAAVLMLTGTELADAIHVETLPDVPEASVEGLKLGDQLQALASGGRVGGPRGGALDRGMEWLVDLLSDAGGWVKRKFTDLLNDMLSATAAHAMTGGSFAAPLAPG